MIDCLSNIISPPTDLCQNHIGKKLVLQIIQPNILITRSIELFVSYYLEQQDCTSAYPRFWEYENTRYLRHLLPIEFLKFSLFKPACHKNVCDYRDFRNILICKKSCNHAGLQHFYINIWLRGPCRTGWTHCSGCSGCSRWTCWACRSCWTCWTGCSRWTCCSRWACCSRRTCCSGCSRWTCCSRCSSGSRWSSCSVWTSFSRCS